MIRLPLLILLGLLHAAEPPVADGRTAAANVILGRPTARTVTASVVSRQACEAYLEYGPGHGTFTCHTPSRSLAAGVPVLFEITDLSPDTSYTYRLCSREPGLVEFSTGDARTFHTQRAPGSAFTFALQGDSHPEREGKMFSPDLYVQTMRNVAADHPDFYLTLGDDFSIERLIQHGQLNQANVDAVYANQRRYLGMVGAAAPLFLVNGNHEQAGRWWLDGTATNPAVLAGRARTTFFPLPGPDGFYAGDDEQVPQVGLLRDYYAWTWGDALFVVIDPYWHSPVMVDHDRRGEKKAEKSGKNEQKRDFWQISMGDAQYRWLHSTLTSSSARFKFVFAHHVLGTGRGGIEVAKLYEWGGEDRNGSNQFAARRPSWPMPVHDLLVRSGVTVFFQGHDHIFAHQELDGVIYQSTPNPADDTYQAFNREAYRSGDVLPNSGHLRITVTAAQARIDYVRSFLPADESASGRNGAVAFSYTVVPRAARPAP